MNDDSKTKEQASPEYFAAKPAEETAQILLNKAYSFFNLLSANSYVDKLRLSWRFYHGAYNNDLGYGHKVEFTGEQGELVSLPVNHFRNLAQHIYVMITANRPVMEARAVNTDYKSLAQTYLAAGILDYYMRERRLEDCIKKAVEIAVVLGAGFVKIDWNATSGEAYDYDEETGQFSYEGDAEFSNLTPLDIIVDGSKESWNNDWIVVRTFKNRYDLMAKYPEQADKIRGIPPKHQSTTYRLAIWSNDETDDIAVYEFYHKRSEALPEGRYMMFLDNDLVLLDSKMPYRVIPIFRISAGDILGTPYGYTPMFDIIPIQEAINSLYSTIMTNQNNFGVQNLFVPRGADINLNSLEGGMNIIEANMKPEPLNLTQTPAEVFKFLEVMIQSAETISGVNSVARGNPEASLKSGTALALVQSMALQFISGLQQSYVKLVEDVGTALLQILKDFAHTPRIIAIVGKSNRTVLKEFTGEQISSINRVVVDIGNPLSRTIAGRVQMAEQMLQMNLLRSPQQYIEVITTGRLDTMYEGDMSDILLTKKENEWLLEGKPVIATILDSHKLHISEHKAVIADPDLRTDPELVKNVIDHIQQHIEMLRNTDPGLLMILNEQPIPPLAPPMNQGAPMPPGMTIPPTNGPMPPEGGQGVNPEVLSPAAGEIVAGIPPQPGMDEMGIQNVALPNLPKVDQNLLVNPSLQDQTMGNIRQ